MPAEVISKLYEFVNSNNTEERIAFINAHMSKGILPWFPFGLLGQLRNHFIEILTTKVIGQVGHDEKAKVLMIPLQKRAKEIVAEIEGAELNAIFEEGKTIGYEMKKGEIEFY